MGESFTFPRRLDGGHERVGVLQVGGRSLAQRGGHEGRRRDRRRNDSTSHCRGSPDEALLNHLGGDGLALDGHRRRLAERQSALRRHRDHDRPGRSGRHFVIDEMFSLLNYIDGFAEAKIATLFTSFFQFGLSLSLSCKRL